jgi:hypothetical protein
MAKKADPLASWKRSVTPTPEAEKAFRTLEKEMRRLPGAAFQGQSQKFPPKYVLDVSSRAPFHRGKRFASVAAVGDAIYFELIELDEAHRKLSRVMLQGAKWTASDGYQITCFGDALLKRIQELLRATASRFQAETNQDSKHLPYKPKASFPIPPSSAWTAPMSWTTPKVVPSDDYSRQIPQNAVFTRAELLFTFAKKKGVGIQTWTEKTLPGLLELEWAKKKSEPLVVAAHAIGFDGKAWSFRFAQKKSQAYMPLFVGSDFARQSPATAELFDKNPMERVELQSVLCLASGKAIRISLTSNFAIEADDEFDDQMEE